VWISEDFPPKFFAWGMGMCSRSWNFFLNVLTDCSMTKKNHQKGEFWVLVHFTEKSFHRIFLTERHLTETPFNRTPFDRTPFDRKAI
jgi:hypothetical protein